MNGQNHLNLWKSPLLDISMEIRTDHNIINEQLLRGWTNVVRLELTPQQRKHQSERQQEL